MSAIELQPQPDYKTAAHSSNTLRAYASDLKHYSQAGYRLPANPEELTDYLKHSGFQYNPRTIKRRLVALRAGTYNTTILTPLLITKYAKPCKALPVPMAHQKNKQPHYA